MKNQNNQPVLFLTLGFPGSGKTYFARRFARDFNLVHLNSDFVRSELFINPEYTLTENKILFRGMDLMVAQLLNQGVSIIYDANVTKKVYRQRLYKMAKNYRSDQLLIWFQTPVEVARKRLAKRVNDGSKSQRRFQVYVDDDVLNRIKDEEEHPTTQENHVVIDGTLPYQKQKCLVEGYLFHSKSTKSKKTGVHNLNLGIMGKIDREHIYSYLDEKYNLKSNNESSNLKPNE